MNIASNALRIGIAFTVLLSTATLPSSAGNFQKNHPRRAQVLNRDGNLNKRINGDYGHLGGNYGKLEHEDNSIRRQEQADARANGGHITKGEQNQLNHEENHLNRQVNRDDKLGAPNGHFAQNHPRRAEVLGRDAGLGKEISNDRGNLSGHYGQLQQEQNNIRNQEQRDAHANGGYITNGQQKRLNQEENRVQNQINKDQ